jgi:hypothetical protein
MRVMFALPAGGPIYIGRSIPPGTPSISALVESRCTGSQTFPAEGIALAKPSSATGHQRRREPVVSEGYYRTEAYRRSGPTLPVPAYSLLEQYRGAGSPSDQAPSQSQSGVPVIRVGVANHSRHRDHAHDPKRPSEVVTQGRHPGTRLVHCGSLWSVHGCVMKRHPRSCARFQTLQHFHPNLYLRGATTLIPSAKRNVSSKSFETLRTPYVGGCWANSSRCQCSVRHYDGTLVNGYSIATRPWASNCSADIHSLCWISPTGGVRPADRAPRSTGDDHLGCVL